MCTLSDRDIRQLLLKTDLVRGYHVSAIQPASIDVRLSRYLIRFNELTTFSLLPHEFAIGSTLEHFHLPDDLQGQIVGKSTIGRKGLAIEFAGYIDPGFKGTITLELKNLTDKLMNLDEILDSPSGDLWIGQVSFMRLTSPAKRPYGSTGLGSHYQGQAGPTLARI